MGHGWNPGIIKRPVYQNSPVDPWQQGTYWKWPVCLACFARNSEKGKGTAFPKPAYFFAQVGKGSSF